MPPFPAFAETNFRGRVNIVLWDFVSGADTRDCECWKEHLHIGVENLKWYELLTPEPIWIPAGGENADTPETSSDASANKNKSRMAELILADGSRKFFSFIRIAATIFRVIFQVKHC
jgi:hypothetical protein